MVKTFSDNREPIQVELIDNKGNKITKTAKFLSNDECKRLGKIFTEMSAKEDDPEANEKNLNGIQEQMAFIFGGKSNDYGKYSPALMKDVIVYIMGEAVNPTAKVQEEVAE